MNRSFALVAAILLFGAFPTGAPAESTLDTVKRNGVLVVGVKDSAPPFGFVDQATGEIIGCDVDIARAISKKLGVNLKLKTVTSASRIPELIDGNIDLISATMSKSADRGALIDFSDTYLKTGQKFLVKAGTVKSLKDLEGRKIATAKGSTSELVARKALPSARIELFDNYLQAAMALKRGEVDAVTTDGAILYGILAMAKERGKYEIPDIRISNEEYALGVRKGDKSFLDFVNATLREMESNGEALAIFDKWTAFVKKDSAPAPIPPPTGQAGGVVFLSTSAPSRFLVMAIKGEFRTGGEVSIYDTQGTFICKGTVKSIYADEIYVDAEPGKAQFVETGYPVAMNLSPDEAKKIILARQDVLKSVKDSSRAEAEQRQKEIAAEYRKEQEERVRYQEEMTKKKMDLEYQYGDRYYYWGGDYYYRW